MSDDSAILYVRSFEGQIASQHFFLEKGVGRIEHPWDYTQILVTEVWDMGTPCSTRRSREARGPLRRWQPAGVMAPPPNGAKASPGLRPHSR